MTGEEQRRLVARNMQLVTALSAVRDMAEYGHSGSASPMNALQLIRDACDEQIARGYMDADDPAEPYRELVRQLIANDSSCPSLACDVTMLGHLLPNDYPELVQLVMDLDETDGIIHRG